jgi:hypothetical protein
MKIARVRNAIYVLSQMQRVIYPELVNDVYEKSKTSSIAVQDMLLPQNIVGLVGDL